MSINSGWTPSCAQASRHINKQALPDVPMGTVPMGTYARQI